MLCRAFVRSLAAALWFATGALAAEETSRSDKAIQKDVADAILNYPYYTVFDSIDLDVHDGVVVLSGSVREPYRKTDIEKRVERVAGIRELRNEIRVQPVSISDDRLRYELVRAIYGHDLFSRYALWADPPVRIVVENGRVTLTGYVSSRVEQVAVGSIARSTLAFSVDNRVRIEGPSAAAAGRQKRS
jgi:hyperosmotically inducible protein